MSQIRNGLRVATCVFEAGLWNHSVLVACRCGHSVRFDTRGLWWALERRGRSDDFRELKRRFYCSRCRLGIGCKVRPATVEASNEPPTVTLQPQPSEAEVRKAVKRARY